MITVYRARVARVARCDMMVTCNLVTDRNRAIYDNTPIMAGIDQIYHHYISDRAYYLFKCLFQYHKATEPQYEHQQLPKYVIGD